MSAAAPCAEVAWALHALVLDAVLAGSAAHAGTRAGQEQETQAGQEHAGQEAGGCEGGVWQRTLAIESANARCPLT